MLIPDWVILAVFAGVGSNILNIINRYLLRDGGDSNAWAWTFEFLRLILFLPFLFFDFNMDTSLKAVLLLVSVGITEFISVYFYMKMHKYSHLSISTILSRTRLVWVPVIAFLFLGERLTGMQYAGIAVLFFGLSIVVAPHKFFIDKGAVYANLAAFMIAINTILLKESTAYASTPVIMLFFSLPSVILFPLFMKNARKRLIDQNLKQKLPKILASVSNVIALFFLMAALRLGDVSRVNAIFQGMLILSVAAGIILLKERQDIKRKLIGTAVTIFGILLLT